jgi:hypothetical protein
VILLTCSVIVPIGGKEVGGCFHFICATTHFPPSRICMGVQRKYSASTSKDGRGGVSQKDLKHLQYTVNTKI